MTSATERDFDTISLVVALSDHYDDPELLFHEYKRALSGCAARLEFVYVIDGNYPAAYETLKHLQRRGEPIRIVKLGRRFGESTALTVGFRYCSGEVILTLPAFRQVDPAGLAALIERLESTDMVVGRRWPRQDSMFNRLQTRLFAQLVRLVTGRRFADLGCNVRAMRRRVCEEVMLYGDQHRFLPILAAHQGFRVGEISLAQSGRERFRRIYPPGIYLRRTIDLLAVFFLMRFTKKPMRFFGLIGSFTAGLGGLWVLYLVFERLALDVSLAERPALLLASLLLVLGFQIFALGLIGELIIYTHARQMRDYVIEEVIGADEAGQEGAESRARRSA